jgi:hypothetical protein
MRTSQSPLKAIFTLQKSEVPLALLMFSYFFLVITSFWILKPIKKALFIEYYDQTGFDLLAWHLSAPQAELLAKVLNMVVAFVAVNGLYLVGAPLSPATVELHLYRLFSPELCRV